MIPFQQLPHLTLIEFLVYEVIHTVLHFAFFEILLYVGLFLILRDRSQIDIRYNLFTGLIVEVAEVILGVFSSFLLIGGAVALILNLGLTWACEFIVLYLRYYEKGKISVIHVFLLYIIAFPFAHLISLNITNSIFVLLGIPNANVSLT